MLDGISFRKAAHPLKRVKNGGYLLSVVGNRGCLLVRDKDQGTGDGRPKIKENGVRAPANMNMDFKYARNS